MLSLACERRWIIGHYLVTRASDVSLDRGRVGSYLT